VAYTFVISVITKTSSSLR